MGKWPYITSKLGAGRPSIGTPLPKVVRLVGEEVELTCGGGRGVVVCMLVLHALQFYPPLNNLFPVSVAQTRFVPFV